VDVRTALVLVAALAAASCSELQESIYGYEEPAWTATSELADGRVFVTDTHIALDVVWAQPETMPSGTFPRERIEPMIHWLERAGSPNAMSLGEVQDLGVDGALRGPGGMLVSPEYIAYLRGKFMFHDVVLYARQNNEDIVVAIDGDFAGVLAPMEKTR
jgi:hypothetical protein